MENDEVYPFFIFDPSILDELPSDDHRLTFIFDTLERLNSQLAPELPISYFFGDPKTVIEQLLGESPGASLYLNSDYEPYARTRDKHIYDLCQQTNHPFFRLKDHVIFEQNEVVKDDGQPYVVFTPYKKRWLSEFDRAKHLPNYPSEQYLFKLKRFSKVTAEAINKLEDFGKHRASLSAPTFNLDPERIENYEATRNFMEVDGTTKLGTYLRFGTQSTRQIVAKALEASNSTFLSELIWREFFQQILWHFPKTVSQSFKPQYDLIKWRNNLTEFERWCEGNTGYALVDAGMRELNQTGYMHNRVRMLTASFLCKHLLIDWRWGEAYFAKKLLDYDMAANVGNWQWAASTGCDAVPYFRIFNPQLQLKKFDPAGLYVNGWVAELADGLSAKVYPKPIVEHTLARERCLAEFARVNGK